MFCNPWTGLNVKKPRVKRNHRNNFLTEGQFTFQMSISKVFYEHHIPSELIIRLCYLIFQLENTPLTLKMLRTFQSKESMTNAKLHPHLLSTVGDFLPMQLISTGNTKRCLPNFDFPHDFNVSFTKNHWSNI